MGSSALIEATRRALGPVGAFLPIGTDFTAGLARLELLAPALLSARG
jgi:hypothetical protein